MANHDPFFGPHRQIKSPGFAKTRRIERVGQFVFAHGIRMRIMHTIGIENLVQWKPNLHATQLYKMWLSHDTRRDVNTCSLSFVPCKQSGRGARDLPVPREKHRHGVLPDPWRFCSLVLWTCYWSDDRASCLKNLALYFFVFASSSRFDEKVKKNFSHQGILQSPVCKPKAKNSRMCDDTFRSSLTKLGTFSRVTPGSTITVLETGNWAVQDGASMAEYVKKGLHFLLKWQWPPQHRETLLVITRTEVSIVIDHCNLKLESAVVARCSKSIIQRSLMESVQKEDIENMERTFDELASACARLKETALGLEAMISSTYKKDASFNSTAKTRIIEPIEHFLAKVKRRLEPDYVDRVFLTKGYSMVMTHPSTAATAAASGSTTTASSAAAAAAAATNSAAAAAAATSMSAAAPGGPPAATTGTGAAASATPKSSRAAAPNGSGGRAALGGATPNFDSKSRKVVVGSPPLLALPGPLLSTPTPPKATIFSTSTAATAVTVSRATAGAAAATVDENTFKMHQEQLFT